MNEAKHFLHRCGFADHLRVRFASFEYRLELAILLAKHAARVGADPAVWRFLSGEPKAVHAFAARFGVSASREDPASPDLLHNLRTAVIDRRGQVATILNGNTWKPVELIEAIRDADAVR